MQTKMTTKPYPLELRERAVRLVRDREAEHGSQWAAIRSIAEKVGCNAETLRLWVRRSERDRGTRPGLTTDERDRLKALERENRELRQANEILRKGEPMERQWSERHWRTRILRRRSSTAGSGHDRVHRRSPRVVWGRADLQGTADRPVDVSR